MSIEYNLTLDDYWQFVKYCQWKKAGRPLLVIIFLGFMHSAWIGELVSIPFFFRSPSIAASLHFLMLPWISWFLYSEVWGLKNRTYRIARKMDGLIGPHRLRIGPLSIRDKAFGMQRCALWESITDIVATQRHIFLILSDQNAFIVPKSAFVSMATAGDFVGLAHRYWEAAKTGQTALADGSVTWPPSPQSMK